MSMISTLQEEKSDKLQEKLRRQSLLSKLRSLNNYLEAIIQKKIRLDLEIKRTRVQITKLKSITSTEVKATALREGFETLPLSEKETRKLLELVGSEEFNFLKDLDEEIDRAQYLLEEYRDLPLFED